MQLSVKLVKASRVRVHEIHISLQWTCCDIPHYLYIGTCQYYYMLLLSTCVFEILVSYLLMVINHKQVRILHRQAGPSVGGGGALGIILLFSIGLGGRRPYDDAPFPLFNPTIETTTPSPLLKVYLRPWQGKRPL